MRAYESLFVVELSEKKQLVVNLLASIVGLIFSIGLNFFISPYIVRTIGAEANGFVQLGTNFINYAALATVALNSMAGRFVSIAVHKNELQKANQYYTAVLYGDCIIASVLAIVAVFVVTYLDSILQISVNILFDVKFFFAFTFMNFFLLTIFTIQGVAPFVRNRLYLDNIAQSTSQIIRTALLVSMFMLFKPRVYYIGLATVAATIILILFRIKYKRILLPDIHAKPQFFDRIALYELLASGVWQLIASGGGIFLGAIDLLVANLFISPAGMGALALAKTIPMVMNTLSGTLVSVFVPQLTISYAKNDMASLKKELKISMKITGVLLTIPFSCVIVLGYEFFNLWVPTQDAMLLHRLSIITCLGFIYVCGISCIGNIFVITNKLKAQSLLVLFSGFLSVVMVFSLLKIKQLHTYGLFIIPAVSILINFLRHMFFTVPFSAKALGLKWTSFYPEVFYSIFSSTLLIGIGYCVKQLFLVNSWLTLFAAAVNISLIGLSLNVMIILNQDERSYLKKIILRSLGKVKSMI